MRTRVVISAVAAVLGCWTTAASAQLQPSGKAVRIGYLVNAAPAAVDHLRAAFKDQLRQLGWTEGENLLIEYRFAEGRTERLPALAAELVRQKVDLIYAMSTPAALAAKNATREIPVVFAQVSDPVASGIVASIARGEGNVTGVTNILPETSQKLLELVKEAVPGASRVAVLRDPANHGKDLEMRELEAAAPTLSVMLLPLEVRSAGDIEAAFSTMARQPADVLITFVDGVTLSHRRRIVELAAERRLPAIYQVREFVAAGGLMSYGLNFEQHNRRGAAYVDKILRGTKPSDLPIERPIAFELVVNLTTARALNLEIPPSILVRADEMIE